MVSTQRLLKTLIWNSLLGLLILFIVNALTNLQIGYLWWPLILSALGGIPGALLAILLHILGII